jgi:hypothetical protein
MPILDNPRHEHFAHLVAKGESPGKAYVTAGFSDKGALQSARRLLKKAYVRARIAELRTPVMERALEKTAISKALVLEKLWAIVQRCMQEKPVCDPGGKPTGEYTFQAMAALRGLELLGKETGMFIDRKRLETRKLSDLSTEELESIVQDAVDQYGEDLVMGGIPESERILRKRKVN